MPNKSSVKNKRGFTLVELLVVISIIAILATIGLTVYTQAQRAARDGKRKADVQQIQTALEQYYTATGAYPGTTTPIDSVSYFPDGNMPKDPAGASYTYTRSTSCTGSTDKYVVCSTKLENGGGNRTAATTDPCSAVGGSSGTTAIYYCVGSISN